MSKTLTIIKELHKKTLASYVAKAANSLGMSMYSAGGHSANSRGAGGDKKSTPHINKAVKRLHGIETAAKKLSGSHEHSTAQDHHDAYHHAMGAHFDHYNNGQMDDGDEAAHAAEYHAKQYHKLTGKKLHDPGYMADSPHITSVKEEVLDESRFSTFKVGDKVQHRFGGDPTGKARPGTVVANPDGPIVHVQWPEFETLPKHKRIAKEHHDNLRHHVTGVKEETLDEVSYRELAQHGIGFPAGEMHAHHAQNKAERKSGRSLTSMDYYHPHTGEKREGHLTHIHGRGYTVKDVKTGERHKFKFEELQNEDVLGEGRKKTADDRAQEHAEHAQYLAHNHRVAVGFANDVKDNKDAHDYWMSRANNRAAQYKKHTGKDISTHQFTGMWKEEILTESMEHGTRVRIHYPEWQRGGLAKHFHGKTGTIIGTEKMKGEPAHHRVRLDHPAHIEGIGAVHDDLWQRSYLKKERAFKDAAATGNPRHFAKEEVNENTLNTDTKINTHDPRKNEYFDDKNHYVRVEVRHPWKPGVTKHHVWSGHGPSPHKPGDTVHQYDDGNGTTKFGRPRYDNRAGRVIPHTGGTTGHVTHVANSADEMKTWPKERLRLYVKK